MLLNELTEVNLHSCDECGNTFESDVLTEQEGEFYCSDCFKDIFTTCSDCCEIIWFIDATTINSNYVCESCVENYSYCDHCNTHVSSDEISSAIRRGREISICNSCFQSDFARCSNCDNIFHDSIITNDLCYDCYDSEYRDCYSCSQSYSRDELNYDEDSGNDYCDSCFARLNRHIHNYSYKPSPQFFRTNKSENVFLGIEIEVDRYECDNSIVEDIQHSALYFKEDGSLNNGFEIVSHPLSYLWIKENKQVFKDRLEKLLKAGFKSYNTNTCGMHIHITKDVFTTWQLYRFLKFFKENKPFVLDVSQRKLGNLEKWANIDDNSEFSEYEIRSKAKSKSTNGERYVAVNLSNYKTVEIRIFRGTLNFESFMKNIEFVYSLFEFTKIANTNTVSLSEYKKFVFASKDYKNLTNFIKTKNL